MTEMMGTPQSRRGVLKSMLAVGSLLTVPGCVTSSRTDVAARRASPVPVPAMTPPPPVVAARPPVPLGVRPELFHKAMAALDSHGSRVTRRDRIAVADFSRASSDPRFHLIDLKTLSTTTLLVAHGSGSDPSHSGWLQRFSNEEGSNASCEGAFVAADYYIGKHGQSQRLIGLDRTNDHALERAIVIHGAWYAEDSMIAAHGKLGRSQGCFAVGDGNLSNVFARLGEGRMLFAAKT